MRSKTMLRPEVVKHYSAELANAEKMKNNPAAYGKTHVKFDPIEEMKFLQEQNITDSSYLEASLEDWKQQGVMMTEQENIPVAEEVETETEESYPEEVIPEDPIEKTKWVAAKLKEVDPKAPDANQLLQWKNLHGNIFLFQVSDDIYVYRYLKRQEWAQMMANPALQKMSQVQISDIIVEKCLLYPKLTPERKAFMPAGAPDTLAEQIRLQSQFLDPVQVANTTIKL